MTAKIIDCIQGSPEWHAARLGVVTASEFSSVLAKGEGKTRRAYMLKLAAEKITGEPIETFVSAAMERGKAMEDEARREYAFMQNLDLIQVGFLYDEKLNVGCSPDSLIGTDGALEIKTMRPDLLIDCMLDDITPPKHKAQLQGTLWVAEREWIDLTVFWPKMPTFKKRVTRDEKYIEMLAEAVADFNALLRHTINQIRKYGATQ